MKSGAAIMHALEAVREYEACGTTRATYSDNGIPLPDDYAEIEKAARRLAVGAINAAIDTLRKELGL